MDFLKSLHPMAKLGAAFLLLQAVFWLGFFPYFVTYASQPSEYVKVEKFEFATVEAATSEALAKADFKDAQPAPALREPGLYAARVTFNLDKVPESGLATLNVIRADNRSIFANGQLAASRGSMDPENPTYRGNLIEIGQISPGLLREGSNTVSIIGMVAASRDVLIVPPIMGEFDQVTTNQGWNEFLQSDFRIITVSLTLMLALLVGAVAFRSSERKITIWLFVLLASWGIYTVIPFLTTFPGGPWVRMWAFTATYFVLSVSWPCFIDAWTRRPWRGFQPAMLTLFALFFSYITYELLIVQAPDAFDRSGAAMDIGGTILTAITIVRLVWHFARHPAEDRIWEGALLLMLLFLSCLYLYDVISDGTNIGYLQKSQPVILLALAVAFFAGRFHLFRSSQQIATLLQEKLDLREAELAQAHQREKELVREQAFSEERTRIMRDMHDGLGSQLMGMLLAARRGKAEPDRVAEGLQQVIDELRLMIDSMDSVGESLGTALAGFRTRLQPRVEDAGFAFEWDNRLGSEPASYPPRRTLQLFRIMQEAVVNALKHSGGNKISISLDTVADEEEWLEVTVRDDGTGIEGPRAGGHGLDNMQARAVKEGGRVEFASADAGEGGVVRILLPIKLEV